jgi:hypothetical protein
VLAAFVPLAREALLLALLPLVVHRARTNRAAALAALVAIGAPVTAWFLWVRWRIGEFPFLDPSISRREAVGVPFVGAVEAIDDADSAALVVAVVFTALVAAATFVVAGRLFLRLPQERLLCAAALLLAVLGLCLGTQAYRFPGDGLRVLMPAHVMLAVIAARNARAGTEA